MAQKQQLIKHGSEAGYRAEIERDDVCDRCRNGHRVFDRQYSKVNKAKGLKYGRYDVLDHLYVPGKTRDRSEPGQRASVSAGNPQARTGPELHTSPYASTEVYSDSPEANQSESPTGLSLADRLREGLFSLKAERKDEYVPVDDTPDYIHPIEPDQEPTSGDWSEVRTDDEFLVTAEGLRAIKDNLGTYLATAGMTIGLIDPYCGTVLRDNLDDMVNSWAKVISHYPTAAKMFMAKGGGKLMSWIDALMATWPILIAVYEHHLSKSVAINSLGQAIRINKSANGQGNADPNMPPGPGGYEYRVD